MIAIGGTPPTISIPITSDAIPEGNETFTLTISNLMGAVFAGGGSTLTQIITILDNDVPTLTIADAEGNEGDVSTTNGTINFMPTLNAPATQPIMIMYSTTPSGIFPVEAGDYVSPSNQTIMIPMGQTMPGTPSSPTPIQIETIKDDSPEPNETFTLTYSAENVTIMDNTATGTIINDDGQVLAITDVTQSESDGSATLNVSLSPAPTNPVNVTFTASTDSAGSSDYTLSSATPSPLEFTSVDNLKPITFNITDDTLDEDSETITVTLTNTDNIAYYQDDRTGTVTITDNDPEPDIEFEILSMDYNEGTDATTNTNVDVTVRIGNNATSGKDITATYTLTGKAKVPSDLKLASNAPGRTSDTTGIITIVAGQRSATIPLEIIGDNYDEIDENFKITLSNVNNATIGTDIFTGTILDDDDPPVAAIMTNYSSFEDSGANDATGLVVTLTPASTKTVKVNYVFSDGSAVKNTNYSGTNGTLTFTPSQVTGLTPTTKFIPFSILDNSNQNASKTFRITLSIPSGGNARTMNPNNRAIVTIVDDESTPVISIVADSGDVAENAGPAMFKLTATGLTATTTLSINATPAEDGADFLTDAIAGTAR